MDEILAKLREALEAQGVTAEDVRSYFRQRDRQDAHELLPDIEDEDDPWALSNLNNS